MSSQTSSKEADISGFSLDSGVATFEGKNILLALEDEPSRANTQTTYENAKALWKGLTGNTKTRYPNGVGKTGAFSYPIDKEFDLTHKLVQEELDAIEKLLQKRVFLIPARIEKFL